jgi:hypothetical protein
VQNPLRDLSTPPTIKLGPEFASVDEYAARVPAMPDLIWLVSGEGTREGRCQIASVVG